LSQYADPAFLDELISWLRFNKKELWLLWTVSIRHAPEIRKYQRWIGKMFVSGSNRNNRRMRIQKNCAASPAAVVIASETDLKTSRVRTGQVYERLALNLTH
jgi:hypothetical protein